jgi:CRP/FNR family transcriptional regulator
MNAWRSFITKYPMKTYDKGQMIICQDSTPSSCYIINKGFVKAYLITAEGTEKPISFEGKNDIFPVDTVFGHSEEAKYFYAAYTPAEIHAVPSEDFVQFVHGQPRFFKRMFNYMVGRTLDYHEHISSLEQAKAFDKLLCALNFLTKRFGREVTKSRAHMTLPLTQQDLANFLGLTRETTGVQLKALEQGGILRYKRQRYMINTARLNAAIAEQ